MGSENFGDALAMMFGYGIFFVTALSVFIIAVTVAAKHVIIFANRACYDVLEELYGQDKNAADELEKVVKG